MSGFAYARVNDICTHGAVIITGSPDCQIDGQSTARLGDLVKCPIHGVNPIISVLPMTQVNGQDAAHVHAMAQCGALVITGSPNSSQGMA